MLAAIDGWLILPHGADDPNALGVPKFQSSYTYAKLTSALVRVPNARPSFARAETAFTEKSPPPSKSARRRASPVADTLDSGISCCAKASVGIRARHVTANPRRARLFVI